MSDIKNCFDKLLIRYDPDSPGDEQAGEEGNLQENAVVGCSAPDRSLGSHLNLRYTYVLCYLQAAGLHQCVVGRA